MSCTVLHISIYNPIPSYALFHKNPARGKLCYQLFTTFYSETLLRLSFTIPRLHCRYVAEPELGVSISFLF